MSFCESCGGKLGEKAKFCGGCGVSRDTATESASNADEPMAPVETTFEAKCSILSQIWDEMRDEEQFSQLISFGDLGIPLAYAIHKEIVETTPEAQKFIDEVFVFLLGILGLEEDAGFEDLDGLLATVDEDVYTYGYEDEDDEGEGEPSLNFFQVNIALDRPIRSEETFRTKSLRKLFNDYTSIDFQGWAFTERSVDHWYSPGYTIAFDSTEYASENMTDECPSCGGLNPRTAQVCYLCCHMLVDEIEGQLFAAVCDDASWHEVKEFSGPHFAQWVDVYYFVAKDSQSVNLLKADIKIFGY